MKSLTRMNLLSTRFPSDFFFTAIFLLQLVPSLLDIRLRQAFGAGNQAASRAALEGAAAVIRSHLISYACSAITSPETFDSEEDDCAAVNSSKASTIARSSGARMISGTGTRGHAELLQWLCGGGVFSPPTSSSGSSTSRSSSSSLQQQQQQGDRTPVSFIRSLLIHARSQGADTLRDVFAPIFREATARLAPAVMCSESPADDARELEDAMYAAEDEEEGGQEGGQAARNNLAMLRKWRMQQEAEAEIEELTGCTIAGVRGIGLGGMQAPMMTSNSSNNKGAHLESAKKAAAVAASAGGAPGSGYVVTLLRPETFEPLLRLLAELTSHNELVKALTSDPAFGWGADVITAACEAGALAGEGKPVPDSAPSGKTVQYRTFLGQLLCLGPQPSDYRQGDGGGSSSSNSGDLIRGYLDISRRDKEDGRDYLLPHPDFGRGGGPSAEADTDEKVAAVNAAAYQASLLRNPAGRGEPVGIAKALPPQLTSPVELEAARKHVLSQIDAVQTALRQGMARHASYAVQIVEQLVKRGAKEAVFAWVGALLDANVARTTSAYEMVTGGGARTAKLSNGSLLATTGKALLHLCTPFLDPSSTRTARIDIRYVSTTVPNGKGGGRFHMRSGEDRMAPFVDYDAAAGSGASGSGGGEGDSSGAPSWIDARNYARQHQFKERHKALVAAAAQQAKQLAASSPNAAASASAAALAAAEPYVPLGSAPSPSPIPFWHPITEMFWLAVRCLHVGHMAALGRQSNLRHRQVGALRVRRFHMAAQLRTIPNGGLMPIAGGGQQLVLAPQVLDYYLPFWQATRATRLYVEAMLTSEVMLGQGAPEDVLPSLQLYRLLAVVLTRAVSPLGARYVGGAVEDAWHILGGPTAKEVTSASAASSAGAASVGRSASAPASSSSSTSASPSVDTSAAAAAGGTGRSLSSPSSSSSTALVPPPVGPPPSFLPSPFVVLPLPPPPAVVCGLPDHLVLDMCAQLTSLRRNDTAYRTAVNGDLPPEALNDVITCLVTLLASPLHVHNPYTKAKIVQALQVLTPHPQDPWRRSPSLRLPKFFELLPTNPTAASALGPALTAFHVDIEFTGSHTVFYDKFNMRMPSSGILVWLWERWPEHRAALERHAWDPASAGRLIRFANAIVGDLLHHMDEALKALNDIRTVQLEKANAALWAGFTEEERRDKETLLSQSKGSARSWLAYATEQVGLLDCLTGQPPPDGVTGSSSGRASRLAACWLHSSVRQRVSTGLGYYLDCLVGPKRKQLKVGDAEALGWAPRSVLLALVTIYNNLADVPPSEIAALEAVVEQGKQQAGVISGGAGSSSGAGAGAGADGDGDGSGTSSGPDPWAESIVTDGRSYRLANFTEAAAVLMHPGFVKEHTQAAAEADRLRRLVPRLTAAEEASAASSETLGEIPEALADSLMFTLMANPVLLPSSGSVMEREVAEKMLLGEERDPFNRAYLTQAMLKPMPELKAAISDWVAARKRKDDAAAEAAVQWATAIREAKGDVSAARAALEAEAAAKQAKQQAGEAAGMSASSAAGSSKRSAEREEEEEGDSPMKEARHSSGSADAPAAAVLGSGGIGRSSSSSAMHVESEAPVAVAAAAAAGDDDDMDEELRAALALSTQEVASGSAAAAAGGGSNSRHGAGAGAARDDDDGFDDDALAAALALSMEQEQQ